MAPRPPPPPYPTPTPSPAALTLRAKLEALNPPPVTPETILRRRRIMQIAYEPRILRAIQRYGPEIVETSIGGVPCLTLTAPPVDVPVAAAVPCLSLTAPPVDVPPAASVDGLLLTAQPVDGVALPPVSGERPILLYCFGGGHVGGEARQDVPISAALAAFTGCRVVAPNTRLAPEHPFPAALDDLTAVYEALLTEAKPIVVAGESAGGNLVLALLIRARRLGLALPRAAALMSPWGDLTPQEEPADSDAGLDPTLNTGYLNVAAPLYAGTAPRDWPEISPLFAAFDAGFPPTLITTGSRDRLRCDCEGLAQRMRAAGMAVDLEVWPGLWHVFEFYDELPEAEASLRQIAAHLLRHGSAAR